MGNGIKIIWRAVFSYFIGIAVTKLLDQVVHPKVSGATPDGKKQVDVDMKPCPICGVYTAQPCSNCKH